MTTREITLALNESETVNVLTRSFSNNRFDNQGVTTLAQYLTSFVMTVILENRTLQE